MLGPQAVSSVLARPQIEFPCPKSRPIRGWGSACSGCNDLAANLCVIPLAGSERVAQTTHLHFRKGTLLHSLLVGFAGILLASALVVGWWRRHAVEQTTVGDAWWWGWSALLMWLVAIFPWEWLFGSSPAMNDQRFYWTIILTVCPMISLLGSRRPTNRIWNWFILVPLIAVLGWPAITVLWRWPEVPILQLQAPVYVGFALVLIMGVGNFQGTRFGFSAILVGIAVVLGLMTYSSVWSLTPENRTFYRTLAALLVGLGAAHGLRQGMRPSLSDNRFTQLWYDFQDTFGIVWSLRIQERINQTAEQEKWESRLTPDGFHWLTETVSDDVQQQTEARMEHTLRWLLRRFVDPEWIDQRLGPSPFDTPEDPQTDKTHEVT